MTRLNRNKIIAFTLPMAGILILLLREPIFSIIPYIPSCFLYQKLHLYCPACGNTRSISALLQGDVLTSIQYNITPVLILLLAVLAYTEFVATSFFKPIRLLPRKLWFYLILIALLLIYYIARNLSPVLAP